MAFLMQNGTRIRRIFTKIRIGIRENSYNSCPVLTICYHTYRIKLISPVLTVVVPLMNSNSMIYIYIPVLKGCPLKVPSQPLEASFG
jgi:hypothetical protein